MIVSFFSLGLNMTFPFLFISRNINLKKLLSRLRNENFLENSKFIFCILTIFNISSRKDPAPKLFKYWTAPLYILYKFYQQKYAAQGTGNQKLNLRFAISTNRRGGSRRWSRSCLYDQINSSKSRQTKSWPFL